MTRGTIRWQAGDFDLGRRVEAALGDEAGAPELIHESRHRRVQRIEIVEESTSGGPESRWLAVKTHLVSQSRHPIREGLKRVLRRTAAQREWLAACALGAAGAPVPRPRVWGRRDNGDEVVVSDFVEGEPPPAMAEIPGDRARGALLESLALAIDSFHGAGFRHGDLHLGNIRIDVDGATLFDLQRARPCRRATDRLHDLAQLELSLARAGWSMPLRQRWRDRLGVDPKQFEPILQRFLRDHARGRGRRVLRVGRQWRRARVGAHIGIRDVRLAEDDLERIVEALEEAGGPLRATAVRRGGRTRIDTVTLSRGPVIVKRIEAPGIARRIRDRFMGSPAARAFRGSQTFSLLSPAAAPALAFLEERRLGLPARSWLVLARVGEEDLDTLRPTSSAAAAGVAHDLAAWLADLHAFGLAHRDLKGGNVRVTREETGATRFWLVDLEDLKGPTTISESAKILALSQLNASLADEAFDPAARRAALATYHERLPFERPLDAIEQEIVSHSLARDHRWRAESCEPVSDRQRR